MENRSLISQLSREQLEKLIEESTSISGMVEAVGLRKTSVQIKNMRAQLLKHEWNLAELIKDLTIKRNFIANNGKKIPLEKLLQQNTNFTPRNRKKELFSKNLLNNECYECKVGDTWNGKPLNLQFDHINGDHRDNRIENLRVLCPNCHSQTVTYSGRNFKKTRRCACCSLEKSITSNIGFCSECFDIYTEEFIIKTFESFSNFQNIINESPLEEISNDYLIKKRTLLKLIHKFKTQGRVNFQPKHKQVRSRPVRIKIEINRKNKTELIKPKFCSYCKNSIPLQNKFFCSNKCKDLQLKKDWIPKNSEIITLYKNGVSKTKIKELTGITSGTIKIKIKQYRKTPNQDIKCPLNQISTPVISFLFNKLKNISATAKIFNCSDNAIIKRLKKDNLQIYLNFKEKRKLSEVNCSECSKTFKPTNKGGKFCSQQCLINNLHPLKFINYANCIKLFLEKKTASQIAKLQNIPLRTVRSYIDQYKAKGA